MTSVTGPLNRETTCGYDTHGNVTSVVQLAETTGAVTTTFTFGFPTGTDSVGGRYATGLPVGTLALYLPRISRCLLPFLSF